MISRRMLFGLGLCGWPGLPARPERKYGVGDLVRIVALPSECRTQWKNCKMNEYVALLRDCLGSTYRVVYVGEDGRPELDVAMTAIARNPRLLGCKISVEPECVALVAKRHG